MGFRFRQGIRIFPGLRLNLSKSGVSTSVGAPGATVNVSKRGIRGTVGVPGSGLSYSKMIYKPGQRLNEGSNVSGQEPSRGQDAPNGLTIDDAERELLLLTMHLVVESGNASTSWLQRKLRIGYTEAAELIAQLEQNGVVSGPDRIGRRKVLVGSADLPPLPEDASGSPA